MEDANLFVAVTIDQRRRHVVGASSPDDVEELRDLLNNDDILEASIVKSFQRTAGDEMQGLLSHPYALVRLLSLAQQHDKAWWFGIGVGSVERLEKTVNASEGDALRFAREAVNQVKKRQHWNFKVVGDSSQFIEAALLLLYASMSDRSSLQWEYVRLAQGGLSVTEVAQRMQVAKSTASETLTRANAGVEEQAEIILRQGLGFDLEAGV